MTSFIAYKNLFTTSGVTVSASTEAAGFEKENAIDWKQYDWWRPTVPGSEYGAEWLQASFASAQAADYMAVWGHNLHQIGGSVTPQYSTDGGTTWEDAEDAIAPTDGRTIYIKFDPVSAADWRCLISATSGVHAIAGVMIGEATALDTGLKPGMSVPALSPIVESKTAMSELGVNLGASVKRTGVSGSIAMTNVSPAWMRSEFTSIVDHLNLGRPAVFAWDPVSYANETLLIWKSGDINPPTYSTPLLMQATLRFEGVL